MPAIDSKDDFVNDLSAEKENIVLLEVDNFDSTVTGCMIVLAYQK